MSTNQLTCGVVRGSGRVRYGEGHRHFVPGRHNGLVALEVAQSQRGLHLGRSGRVLVLEVEHALAIVLVLA